MIKALKTVLFIAGLCIMLIFGNWSAGQRYQLDMQKEIRLTTEYVEEHAENWLQAKIPKAWQYDLTEEEQDFLKQHVFGTWYFSKRIIALEERDEGIANFSEQGMEEIKENIRIEYGRYNVESSGYTGEVFSTTEDIYLFAEYGGMTSVNYPVYHIETEVEEERLALHHIYIEDNVSYAGFPEKCELVHVFYDLGYDEQDNTSVDVHYAGDIYVNPKDTDILYWDFGGLWEMKRVRN